MLSARRLKSGAQPHFLSSKVWTGAETRSVVPSPVLAAQHRTSTDAVPEIYRSRQQLTQQQRLSSRQQRREHVMLPDSGAITARFRLSTHVTAVHVILFPLAIVRVSHAGLPVMAAEPIAARQHGFVTPAALRLFRRQPPIPGQPIACASARWSRHIRPVHHALVQVGLEPLRVP
jgi:hypothetical protein